MHCRSDDLSNTSPGRLVHHTEEIPRPYFPRASSHLFEDGEDCRRAVIDDLELEIATPKARVVTLKHEKKFSSNGLLAARKAASRLASAKRAARLAFDKANQEARFEPERVKGAHVALDRENGGMCPANQRLEELGWSMKLSSPGELQEGPCCVS